MFYTFILWYLYFISYGIIGRLAENAYVTLYRFFRHQNLHQPLFTLPIFPIVYGLGGIALVIFDEIFQISQYNFLLLFFICAIVCGTIEFLSGLFLDLTFGKNIWWNYSNRRFNLKGWVCLENTFWFGIGGLLILKFIQPFLKNYFTNSPYNQLIALALIATGLIIIDQAYSVIYHHKNNEIWSKGSKPHKKIRLSKKAKHKPTNPSKV